jgi:hypothetical protein
MHLSNLGANLKTVAFATVQEQPLAIPDA